MIDTSLHRMTFGFRASRAVMAGVSLGVFDTLAPGPLSAEEVAAACGLDPAACLALLDALASLGVLAREGERFANGEAADRTLTRGGPATRRHVVLHDLWNWSAWSHLEQAIRSGEPVRERPGDPFLSDPAVLAAFLPNLARAMTETSREESRRLVEQLELRGDERLLDLGGGLGNFSVALVRRHPRLRAVVLDLPPVAREAGLEIEREGCSDRIAVHAANFLRDPLDPDRRGFDAVLLSRVLMGLDAADAEALLARVRDVLRPGGRVIVYEFHRSESGRSDPVSALLNLDMLLLTGGCVRSPARLLRLLEACGLEKLDARGIGPRHVLIHGSRREAA